RRLFTGCAPANRTPSPSPPVPVPGSRSCARWSLIRCLGRRSRWTCWCPTTAVTWCTGRTPPARSSPPSTSLRAPAWSHAWTTRSLPTCAAPAELWTANQVEPVARYRRGVGESEQDERVGDAGPAHSVDAALDEVVAAMGGARRTGQHEMARAVTDTLDDGAHLLVQAGTGTGKSLAYLVPTLLKTVSSGQRAIVSTATLALQRQILGHDLPLVTETLTRHLGHEPDVALLKGWHNYVCKHKVAGGYPDDEGALFAATEAAPSTAEEHPGEAEESLGGQV